MRIRNVLFLLATLPGLLLGGCGGLDNDAPVAPTNTQLTGAATIGAATCVQCHLGATPEKTSQWLSGRHGNPERLPDNGYFFYQPVIDCTPCHNPLADGADLAAKISGQFNRPVIGCESCHGGGALHPGNWSIAYPRSTRTKCAGCHYLPVPASATYALPAGGADLTVTQAGHGLQVGERVSLVFTSGQNLGLPADGTYTVKAVPSANTLTVSTAVSAGGVAGDVVLADAHTSVGAYTQAGTTVVTVSKTAHRLDVGDLVYLNFVSGQSGSLPGKGIYPVATVVDANTFVVTADAATAAGKVLVTEADRTNADTHSDDPATGTTTSGTIIEGYVIRPETGCNDCHNAHTADITIQRDWAQSAHAGHLLSEKEAGGAGVTEESSAAWSHYNWDNSTGNPYTSADPDRKACQRCHTSTGVANFLTDPAGYSAARNDFSHLAGWAAAKTSPQNEMLYCWGCHTDASSGALRQPGAISFSGSLAYTNGATASYPDIKGSNLCLACHSGLETGDSIKLDQDADGIRGFINSHYLAAGGTLFSTTGYEFDGLDYSDLPIYKHKFIGVSETGTGSNGPCVGCHMSRTEKHLFMPVTKDAVTDAVVSVDTAVCGNCHFGADMVVVANTAKAGYEDAAELTLAALAGKGIHFHNAYPYFFTAPYVVGGTNTSFTNWAGVYGLANWKQTMGAAFNANLLIHDPGGYVHNRTYAKRLLFDSIDYIDNGKLDGTIDCTGYPEAAGWFAENYADISMISRP